MINNNKRKDKKNNNNNSNNNNVAIIIILFTIIIAVFMTTNNNVKENGKKEEKHSLELVEEDKSDDTSGIDEKTNKNETEVETKEVTEIETENENEDYTEYYFRSDRLLEQHYDKHGIEMGFESKEDYEKAASDVVNNKNALHKIESEDGDDVYYIEDTNEFVIVSKDGYIRTYFNPGAGIDYFNRQ